jgi:putative transposase
VHIQPGKPRPNGYVESFNGKFRDECLNASWFGNLFEAPVKIAAWREEYNAKSGNSRNGKRQKPCLQE